jgi:hypothetical protein
MNALQTLTAYRHNGGWAFDEERFGLVAEPFVLGADKIVGALAGDADEVVLIFSDQPFPGAHRLRRLHEEEGGYWYDGLEGRGWLCPATLHYFPDGHPESIYMRSAP